MHNVICMNQQAMKVCYSGTLSCWRSDSSKTHAKLCVLLYICTGRATILRFISSRVLQLPIPTRDLQKVLVGVGIESNNSDICLWLRFSALAPETTFASKWGPWKDRRSHGTKNWVPATHTAGQLAQPGPSWPTREWLNGKRVLSLTLSLSTPKEWIISLKFLENTHIMEKLRMNFKNIFCTTQAYHLIPFPRHFDVPCLSQIPSITSFPTTVFLIFYFSLQVVT